MGCTVSPEPKPSLVLARRVHSGQLGVTAGSVPVSLFRYTCRGGRAVGRAARAGGGRRWGARWRSRVRARAVPGGQPAPPSAAPYPAWALSPVLVWHAGSPPPVQARIHMHVRMSVSRLHTGVAPPADLPASQAPRHGLRAQALAQTGSAHRARQRAAHLHERAVGEGAGGKVGGGQLAGQVVIGHVQVLQAGQVGVLRGQRACAPRAQALGAAGRARRRWRPQLAGSCTLGRSARHSAERWDSQGACRHESQPDVQMTTCLQTVRRTRQQ